MVSGNQVNFCQINILTGYVTSFFFEDQEMTKRTKLLDMFTKINDNYTVTNCNNGFVVEVSGHDSRDEWITGKFVVITVDELKDVVHDLAAMPKS